MPSESDNFEALFAELQQVVQQLQAGDADLDQMLSGFERGVHLIRQCRSMLDTAQARIQELVEIDDNGNARLRDFEHAASIEASHPNKTSKQPTAARPAANGESKPADEDEELLF